MNMILHHCPTAEVGKDNVLSNPYFKQPNNGALKTFDFVVSNPPFSTKKHGAMVSTPTMTPIIVSIMVFLLLKTVTMRFYCMFLHH